MKSSTNVLQVHDMFAMDPRAAGEESRSEPIFFGKFWKKIDFASAISLQTSANDVFPKATHMRHLANVKKYNFEAFKVASGAILCTPQTQTFWGKTDIGWKTSEPVPTYSGVPSGVRTA